MLLHCSAKCMPSSIDIDGRTLVYIYIYIYMVRRAPVISLIVFIYIYIYIVWGANANLTRMLH